MEFNEITVSGDVLCSCSSNFFSAHVALNSLTKHVIKRGINDMQSSIDSGPWALSYLLSMYNGRKRKNITIYSLKVELDGCETPLELVNNASCYLDLSCDMFSNGVTVKKQIERGLKKSGLNHSAEEIKEMFALDDNRFLRPLSQNGNEALNAMAAIGYSSGKDLFCFPWYSARIYEYLYVRIDYLANFLSEHGKTVILPRE